MSARIVVVGSLNTDHVSRIDRAPAAGETVLGHDFTTLLGGKGANQAVACARMGASVAMVGCVGKDAGGKALVEGLAAEGIDVTLVDVSPAIHLGRGRWTESHRARARREFRHGSISYRTGRSLDRCRNHVDRAAGDSAARR